MLLSFVYSFVYPPRFLYSYSILLMAQFSSVTDAEQGNTIKSNYHRPLIDPMKRKIPFECYGIPFFFFFFFFRFVSFRYMIEIHAMKIHPKN